MDKIERKILKGICGNLRASTHTNWSEGDVEKWANWANSMKQAILDSVNIVEKLIEEDEEEKQEKGIKL